MSAIAAGSDPWRAAFRRHLRRWWPAGILAVMAAAAAIVLTFPHGSHSPPDADPAPTASPARPDFPIDRRP